MPNESMSVKKRKAVMQGKSIDSVYQREQEIKEKQECDIQNFALIICKTNPECSDKKRDGCDGDHFLCHPCKVHAERLYASGYRKHDIKLTAVK
jgi:hypothetical protein